MTDTFQPPVEYLRDCSDTSLRHYEVSKLEHVANLRRELRVLWEEMLEEAALAHLARWMIENRAHLRSETRSIEPSLAVLGEPSLAVLGEPPPRTKPCKMTLGDPSALQVSAAAPLWGTSQVVARCPVLVEPAQRSSAAREPDSSPGMA